LGGANQGNWLRLLDVLEAPELSADPRFAEPKGRMDHLEALETTLNAIFRQRGSADWLARFEAAGLPAGPVQSILEMQADPQTLARQMVVETEHAKLGPVKTLGLPVKFSETPGEVATGAPVYGEHSRAVLAEHGFSDAEIAALIAEVAVIAD